MIINEATFQIIGNVGTEPELKQSGNGTTYCNLFVLVNDSIKQANGEYRQETNPFSLVAFAKTAELISKHVSKGNKVLIRGRINRKQDQNNTYQVNFVVLDFSVMSKPSGSGSTPPPPGSY
jgi:single-strand DNA-binding protein